MNSEITVAGVRPRVLRRVLIATAAGAILAGTGIGYAAQADATPVQDVAYLSTLDKFGVPYSSASNAVAAGLSVCNGLDAGLTLTNLVVIAVNAGYTPSQSGYIIGAAIGAYCDQYAYLIPHAGGGMVA